MKSISFFVLLMLAGFSNAYSQKLLIPNVQKVNEKVSDPKELDSLYPSAYDMNPAIYSVFPDKPDEVAKAWVAFHNNLANYLAEKKFTWLNPTRGFCKAYFNKEGGVDYVFFNFKELEKHEEFKNLVKEFIKNYKFQLASKESNFSQCGVVVFKDKEAKQ